jgi:hypothetical protein
MITGSLSAVGKAERRKIMRLDPSHTASCTTLQHRCALGVETCRQVKGLDVPQKMSCATLLIDATCDSGVRIIDIVIALSP